MISLRRARIALLPTLFLAAAMQPVRADSRTETFAVMRGDDQIGTNTISLQTNGLETDVRIVTHVAVKAFFLTLYHFDFNESERWRNGRLVAMNSDTDDNGTLYKTNASSCGDALVVQTGGRERRVALSTVPTSLWNAAVLSQNVALDPRDGNLVPVKVVDHGEDSLVVSGRTMRAHHYSITTTFSQDVWYDADHRVVKLQLKASDGSTIRYQLV